MLSVPSLRLNQFGVNFYEALLSGADLQSLVGFEVLSFGPAAQTTRGHARQTTSGRVNWEANLFDKRHIETAISSPVAAAVRRAHGSAQRRPDVH